MLMVMSSTLLMLCVCRGVRGGNVGGDSDDDLQFNVIFVKFNGLDGEIGDDVGNEVADSVTLFQMHWGYKPLVGDIVANNAS